MVEGGTYPNGSSDELLELVFSLLVPHFGCSRVGLQQPVVILVQSFRADAGDLTHHYTQFNVARTLGEDRSTSAGSYRAKREKDTATVWSKEKLKLQLS